MIKTDVGIPTDIPTSTLRHTTYTHIHNKPTF